MNVHESLFRFPSYKESLYLNYGESLFKYASFEEYVNATPACSALDHAFSFDEQPSNAIDSSFFDEAIMSAWQSSRSPTPNFETQMCKEEGENRSIQSSPVLIPSDLKKGAIPCEEEKKSADQKSKQTPVVLPAPGKCNINYVDHMKKTVLCWENVFGRCRKRNCDDAHIEEALRLGTVPYFYKTKMCEFYHNEDLCRFSFKCRYLHFYDSIEYRVNTVFAYSNSPRFHSRVLYRIGLRCHSDS